MVSKLVFVDTSMFKGLIDKKDEFHPKAIKIWQNLSQKQMGLITNNFILDETYTLLRSKCGRKTVGQFREELMHDYSICRVSRVITQDEVAAWEWFEKDWRSLSFTDCVSFAMMKRLGIRTTASFDQHFVRAGFRMA